MIAEITPHIIDTAKIVINNNTPEKSFTEIYAPYIASGITAIITLIVLIFTLRSNRKRIREDNLMKIRKEWIQDFSKLCAEIYKTMKDDRDKPFNPYDIKYIQDQKQLDNIKYNKLSEYRDELEFKVRVDGTELMSLSSNVTTFLYGLKEYFDSNYVANHREQLNIDRSKFKYDSLLIIQEETELLKGNHRNIIHKFLNLKVIAKFIKWKNKNKIIMPKK